MPRKKRTSDGIDPRILALGAGAGAVGAAASAVAQSGSGPIKKRLKAKGTRITETARRVTKRAGRSQAADIMQRDYLAQQGQYKDYMSTADRSRGTKTNYSMEYDALQDRNASRKIGDRISARYNTNRLSPAMNIDAATTKLDALKSSKTFKRPVNKAKVGASAMGAASIAMIVAQVLKELNKK
jgi:hypothetical protein